MNETLNFFQVIWFDLLVKAYCFICIVLNVSVFFGAHESTTGGVKIESIFFQDSVWLSGLVLSALCVCFILFYFIF